LTSRLINIIHFYTVFYSGVGGSGISFLPSSISFSGGSGNNGTIATTSILYSDGGQVPEMYNRSIVISDTLTNLSLYYNIGSTVTNTTGYVYDASIPGCGAIVAVFRTS
jgi:hypothetical protein